MDKPRPYVTAALLCERVIQEKDESLTLVRIADKIQYLIQGPGLPAGLKPMINLNGLVSIKSGPVTGEHKITIVMQRPDAIRKELYAIPVKFLGEDQGQNVILNIALGVEQDGLYWFDVLFEEEVLTRIPLMVMPLQEQLLPGQNT